MTDFVSGLRAELVAAAEREERRRLPLLPAIRLRPLVPALAVAALLAIAAVVVLTLTHRGDEHQVAKPHGEVRPLFGGTVTPKVRLETTSFFVPIQLTFPDNRWIANPVGRDYMAFERQPLDINVRPKGSLSFGRVGGKVYDPADPRREIPTPPDLLAFLSSHPDIDAGAPRPTTFAGHRARVMDLTFRFKRPLRSALYCQGQGFRCTQLAPGRDFHPDGERDRVWEVQTSHGRLYVTVAGWAPAFRRTLRAAQPILAGLKIDG